MTDKLNKTGKADESDDTEGFSEFVNPSDSCVDFKSIKKVCFYFAFSNQNQIKSIYLKLT